jgi:polar amino acid transport system substrate-binding protein
MAMLKLRQWVSSLVLATAFAALLVGVAAAQSADALDTIVKRGKVVIGIDLGQSPFGFLDSDKQPAGADVETARMLAKDLGVSLEITQLNSANRIPYLLTGKVDLVMATFSITPERAKTIAFSTPYGVNNSVVFAPASETIKSAADLVGKKIAVTRGTGNESMLAAVAPPGAQIIRFNDEASSLAALASGQADAYASDETIAKSLDGRFPDKHFETKFFLENGGDFYAIGVKRGDPDLLRWLDTFVYFHRENGDLSRIYQKYVGAPLGPLPSL